MNAQYLNLPVCFAEAFVSDDKSEITHYWKDEFEATVNQLDICYPKGWHFINISTHDNWFDRPDIGARRLGCTVCTYELVPEPGIHTLYN